MPGLTIDNPISLGVALTSVNVIPGDAIYLRAGTYTGDWLSSIAGTAEAPVTIQPYEDPITHELEPVTIDGPLRIAGAYTHWLNLTLQNSIPNRSTVYMTMPGTELQDCDVSGAYLGVEWFGSGVGKIDTCTFHDTGSYGIYTSNHLGGLREITDCTFTNIGSFYDLHAYSESSNAVRDYLVSGCTFGKFVVVHSPIAVTNIEFTGCTFGAPLHLGNGLTIMDDREFDVNGNTFDGSSGIRAWTCSVLSVLSNVFAVQTSNIVLVLGENEVTTSIDSNDYTGGTFSIDGVSKSWTEWQAAGYDLNGSYTA